MQALTDVGKLPTEIHEASTLSRAASEASEAQRARVAKIANPARHPGPVQKHLHRARRLAAEAQAQAKLARKHTVELGVARLGVAAAYAATPAGGALMVGLPPDQVLTETQRRRDRQNAASHLTPEGGMPRDTRLDIRVASISRHGHR